MGWPSEDHFAGILPFNLQHPITPPLVPQTKRSSEDSVDRPEAKRQRLFGAESIGHRQAGCGASREACPQVLERTEPDACYDPPGLQDLVYSLFCEGVCLPPNMIWSSTASLVEEISGLPGLPPFASPRVDQASSDETPTSSSMVLPPWDEDDNDSLALDAILRSDDSTETLFPEL